MEGRVCLVTGATNGIGLCTAEALARLGARVIVHGRDRARVAAVERLISERSGNSEVSGVVADFSSLDDVRRMAAELGSRLERLDVLVNNAGGLSIERRTTREGFEWHFGVNHLAPFLLTNLLLDRIRAGERSRIVCVASNAHRRATLDLDDLNFERGYDGRAAYARSKLANVLFAAELARRLQGTGIAVNSLHPGVVATNLFDAMRPPLSWVVGALKPFLLSAEEGAKTSVYLASSPDVEGVTGRYFARSKEALPTPEAQDAGLGRKLWESSARLCRMEGNAPNS